MTVTKRITTCRVLDKLSNACTAEAVDPDGELLICSRHLAAAMRTLDAAKARITGKAKP